VNATGPWVKRVRDALVSAPARENVRHVKGSHIVVPRVHRQPHAYILQNADKRIVFVIPYQDEFSLIGTTDVPVEAFEAPQISEQEIDYLLDIANAYLARPLARKDVVWTFSGVRPLYDDGATDPSAITRDYVLKLDTPGNGERGAPLLSVFGGKLTTYRKLAEHVLAELRPFFPAMTPTWTEGAILPGGDLPIRDVDAWAKDLKGRYPWLPVAVLRGLVRRHGTRALTLLDGARKMADLGTQFGGGLTALEIDWLIREEWARTGEDVLWRRTKAGLAMTREQRDAATAYVERAASRPIGERVDA
jgi:glycerol-3-phosphate dehydrogenase